jgi:hypothetical protein
MTASAQDEPPDTVVIPLKIRAGLELAGPVIYFTDKNNLSFEGYVSGDLNEKMAIFLGGGYADFKYSQYNYDYLSRGVFIKAGVDFNLLKPEINMGKYWAGIGLHYGQSIFTSETPSFEHENYWGTTASSIPSKTSWGHFLEISPGFKAELFNNFSIGWSVSLRRLIYSGTTKDLMPVYIPGFGTGGKTMSFAMNYFITINIPYRKIRVAIKKEVPEETEEQTTPQNP